jgi:thymidine kinase
MLHPTIVYRDLMMEKSFLFFDTCRRVVLVKSDKDTRYTLNSVVSHDGAKMPCWAVADLASFKDKLGEEAYKQVCKLKTNHYQFI